jgi:hypothetical protein
MMTMQFSTRGTARAFESAEIRFYYPEGTLVEQTLQFDDTGKGGGLRAPTNI